MDLGIKGKTALVCAASKGLGKGCAMALAQEGVDLVIVARGVEALEATAKEIRDKTGVKVTAVIADITTEDGRKKALAACPAPDILVNNAGGPPPGDFRQWDRETWIKALDANMLTPIELIRATVDKMIERRFGRIVNITSFVVKELYPNMAISNTVRIALTGAAATLAREVIEHGVTVNNILPGLMDTGALQRVFKDRSKRQGIPEDEVKKQMAASVPAKRLGTADDFGPVCAFLCSRQAGYITGQNITVDGGLVKSLI
jgi:3-oxoacyl-[acyl-carrier protein] reductase